MVLSKHRLFWPLLAGLIARFSLAPWTEQRWDSYTNRLVGSYIFVYGINPFIPESSCNCPAVLNYSYPPLWLVFLISTFRVWLAVTTYSFPASVSSLWAAWNGTGNLFEAYRSFIPADLPLLDTLLKAPVILSDIAIGYLIWRIGGRSTRAARVSLLTWVLNPYVILIGTVWGQFDSIAALFLILSVFFLQKYRFFLSGLSLSLGVATKLFPAIVFFPTIFYLVLYRREGLARYIGSFLLGLSFSLSIAFIFPNAIEYIVRLLIGRSSPNYGGTAFFSGLTWMLIFNQYPLPPGIPVFPIVLATFLAVVLLMFRKSLKRPGTLVPFLTTAFLGVYLSYPSINPQYVIWVLPLFAVLLASKMISKWAIAIFSTIPLVFILTHYNPLYLISPAIIPDENNFLPASDVVKQLWNFSTWLPQLPVILAAAFTIIVILTVDDLMTRSGVVQHPIHKVEGS